MPTPLITQITLDQLNGDRLITGDGRLVSGAFSADASLVGAAVRFTLSMRVGTGWQHLLTLTRAAGGIAITTESADSLGISFLIPGSLTGGLSIGGTGKEAQFDVEVVPVGGEPITVQGRLAIAPSTPTASTGQVTQTALQLHLSDGDPHPQYVQPTEIDALLQQAVEGIAPAYERAFTQADLSVAGVLAVIHNLDAYPSGITVYSNSGQQVEPDSIEFANSAAIAIHLQSFEPLSGSWKVSVTL